MACAVGVIASGRSILNQLQIKSLPSIQRLKFLTALPEPRVNLIPGKTVNGFVLLPCLSVAVSDLHYQFYAQDTWTMTLAELRTLYNSNSSISCGAQPLAVICSSLVLYRPVGHKSTVHPSCLHVVIIGLGLYQNIYVRVELLSVVLILLEAQFW